MPYIRIPTPLRKFTQGESRIQVEGADLLAALDDLVQRYPDLGQHLLDSDRSIRPFLRVYVGDQDVQTLGGAAASLQSEDVVSLVPAIAGGKEETAESSADLRKPRGDFSKAELERYSRHLIIPEFNLEGQKRLKDARVLVVGTGGLGAPLLQYLAAAGIGTIGVLDFDRVEDSNLQRQVLFTTADIGRPKVEVAAERIRAQNPYIQVNVHQTRLTSENALDIIKDYDIVADGTDNFPTRYLVNDACVLLDKVNVYASIFRFEGQVSVFNWPKDDGSRGPNYRDLFPQPPPPGLVPSCAEGGVIGVLPGILGSLQANEVIKVASGVGQPLAGRLLLVDAADLETRVLRLERNPENPLNGENPSQKELIDYQEFCGLNEVRSVPAVEREIDVQELKTLLESEKPPVVIDVREPHEYAIVDLGGRLIPQDQIRDRVDEIPQDGQVVVHCRSGVRSARVIDLLEREFGFRNLYNLKGGVLAWAEEIDQSLATY